MRKPVPKAFTWDVQGTFKSLSSLIQLKDLNLGLLYPRSPNQQTVGDEERMGMI